MSRKPTSRRSTPPFTATAHRLDDPATLRDFIQKLREGVYISSSDGRILDANPAFLDMFGVTSVEELSNANDLFVDPERRREELRLLERDGAVREFEFQLVRPDGDLRTVLDTTYAVHNRETGVTLYHGILVDITSRKHLENQLIELSLRDPLTGCYNRRYLTEIEQQLTENPSASWGCIFIDIDHFKRYNDRHGHAAGDKILVRMSRFLMRQVRAEEAVVRIGGDEFIVVLANADEKHTERVARRLQLSALRTAPVPFSLGWATRKHGEAFEKVMIRADHELLTVRVIERDLDDNKRRADD